MDLCNVDNCGFGDSISFQILSFTRRGCLLIVSGDSNCHRQTDIAVLGLGSRRQFQLALMEFLTFLFQIVPVCIKPEVPENRKFGGYWFPPENKEDFVLDEGNRTGWFQWTADVHSRSNALRIYHLDPASSADEEVCSIFFDSECGYFLVAPTDCSQTGAVDQVWDLGWKRLGFDHLEQGAVSKLTFVAEHHTLGGIGAEQWMPQLLPETYDNHETSIRTELIGDLILLVAMAAFTCEPRREEFLATMSDHFRPPHWHPRVGKPSIKCLPHCHRKGLIVKIRPVPNSAFQKEQLKLVENGKFGSIFSRGPPPGPSAS